jgi:uncharacterized ion transporter superfamily protein YfcC
MVNSGAGEDARMQAVKRIKRKRMFQQQLIVFVLINVLLWVIWAATGAGFPWPIFVTVFWGLGIATQAWAIYRGTAPITEAQIEREMGKGSDAT